MTGMTPRSRRTTPRRARPSPSLLVAAGAIAVAVLAVVLAVGHGISDGGGGTAASCVGPQLSPEPDPQPDVRVPVSLGDMARGEQVTLYGRWYLAECHDTVEVGDTWEPGPPMTDVPLTLTSAGSERVLATAHPDQQGSFAVTVRIPDDLPLGPAAIRDDLGQTLALLATESG